MPGSGAGSRLLLITKFPILVQVVRVLEEVLVRALPRCGVWTRSHCIEKNRVDRSDDLLLAAPPVERQGYI